MDLYESLVTVHVVAAIVFVGAHAVSAYAVIRLRGERDLATAARLVNASKRGLIAAYLAFATILLTGIANGVMGGWFTSGLWIWASLAILAGILVVMHFYGSRRMDDVRRAAGIEPIVKEKGEVVRPAGGPEEIGAATARLQPALLAAVGVIGFAAVVWLMIAKPF